MKTRCNIPLALLSAALLAACNAPSEPSPEGAQRTAAPAPAAPAPDSLSVPLLRTGGWAAFDSLYRYPSVRVTSDELIAARDLFGQCFRQAPGVPLTSTSFEVPWSELTAHLPARVSGTDRAVLFHYGLDAPAMQLAWSYRTVAQAANNAGLHDLGYTDHRAYSWVGGAPAVATEDDWVWAHQQRPDGRTYFNAVQINRLREGDLQDHWDAVRSYDANACLLHWERELERMYTDNASQFTGRERYVYLVVHCTAEWREDGSHTGPYIAHTVTAHLRVQEPGRPAVDLITNAPEDPARPFYNRGADYGNLCPVRCGAVELR